MATEIWLAIVSALLTVIGCFFMVGLKSVSHRLAHLEQQDGKIISALLMLLIAKAGDAVAVAEAMHALINRDLPSV